MPRPRRYNDPDNILGPHGTVGSTTPTQAQTQFLLWALFPAPIILGEDLTQVRLRLQGHGWRRVWALNGSRLHVQATLDYLSMVGNIELLAVNEVRRMRLCCNIVSNGCCHFSPRRMFRQDAPFAGPATRIVGGDLSWPCTPAPAALYSVQVRLQCHSQPAPTDRGR